MSQPPRWVDTPSADGAPRPSQQAPESPGRKPGILVADDEPLVREVLEVGLDRAGFQVWAVSDGWQVLILYERLRQEVAAVLLDVCMPGLDGPETLNALRRVDPGVRCCFMSGNLGNYTTTQLLERGAAQVFAKPFQLEELAEALWGLVSQDPWASTDQFPPAPGKDF